MQNFIRSLSEQITNKELTEKILQFFSDIPTTSHALKKLRLIRQELDESIVNYNQRYQNLVERVEGCPLNSITSTVVMELCLGSIIKPIRKSIRNTFCTLIVNMHQKLWVKQCKKLKTYTSSICMHQGKTNRMCPQQTCKRHHQKLR